MKRTQITRQHGTEASYRLLVPELGLLREIDRALARGRIESRHHRSPEEDVRLALFRIVREVLQFAGFFESLLAEGRRCKIVEREHPSAPYRLVIEFVIEVQP